VTLRAGAVTVDITPPVGVRMDGYGARTEPSRAVHDPLFARILVLVYGEQWDDDQWCALVSCDLLGMHRDVSGEARGVFAVTYDTKADNVLIASTHNHAGPAGLRGGMFARLDDKLVELFVWNQVSTGIGEAFENLRPARLKVGQTTIDSISQNRRDPDGPIDPVLRVLLVDGEDGPIASVLNFACHATVLSGENLMLSAEFPGVACRLLQQQTGVPALFLQGACANVNPTWIKQDFASVERAGQIVGGAALRVVAELRAVGKGQRAHNIRWDVFPEKPVAGRIIEPRLRAARREIEVPLRQFLADDEYASRIDELEAQAAKVAGATDERRAVMAQLTRYQNERWAATWARRQPEITAQRTEIQALSLGEGLAVLALPGEFFVETADAIRERSGIEDLLVVCYANDYIGYVVPPAAYEEGGYEAGITFCTPEAEGIIVDASLELLRDVINLR
jgi:neutral ceramidase